MELLVCQENVIRHDNALRGLPSTVRKRQDKVRHTPVRAKRWPPPELSLPKGTGDHKAEHHHAEALNRPTVESEVCTNGRKTPGIGWVLEGQGQVQPQRGLIDGTESGQAIRSSLDLAQAACRE